MFHPSSFILHPFLKRTLLVLALFLFSQLSLAQLSGSLNGSLHPEIYHVTDTISVEQGQSLTLLGGTVFIFDGPFPFYIYGNLTTEGSAGDSIVFTADTSLNPTRWRGLRFANPTSSASNLNFCRIEFAGITEGLEAGGGISCVGNAAPNFAHCTVRYNDVSTGGAGVSCFDSSPSFTGCVIRDNRAEVAGGGLYCFFSNPVFNECFIESNRTTGQYGSGGGMQLVGSSPQFTDCVFRNNDVTTFGSGGAMYCEPNSNPIFERCDFINNHSNNSGVGFFYEADPLFSHCLFYGNHSEFVAGIYAFYTHVRVVNSTFSGNNGNFTGGLFLYNSTVDINSTVIAYSNGPGINFWQDSTSYMEFCLLYNNQGGNISFYNGDSTNGPDGIGRMTHLNHNNSPCDIYGNLIQSPQFVDRVNLDFHLLENSPCINAGDSTLPHDPDNSFADIGRYYYGEVNAVEPHREPLTQSFYLHQNYPNPFNNQTRIVFDLAKSGKVELALYDITGRLAQTLLSDFLSAGVHEINLNSDHLSSGVYFYRLSSENLSQTRKMVLLK